MKVIDNTIKYYELLMSYNDTSKYIKYELPYGYHYEFYKPGDEDDWIKIHISSGEFTSFEKGLQYFHSFYDSFIDEISKRCFFIVDNNTNDKIGTATISLLKDGEYGYKGAVDWLAIKKEYQGRKLARPLISKVISLASELGHNKIILHTQTTTWLAAKLYLDAGFEPYNTNEINGWKILKRLTNHTKLKDFEKATDEEMYDKRNIEIEQQLNNIYGIGNFNYSVWYKDGLHNVYVYSNGKSYEYEYFEDNDRVVLKILDINRRVK